MNYTIDELLRYADFSGPYGEQIKQYLEDYKTEDDIADEVNAAYGEGVRETRETIQEFLFGILDNSEEEGDELIKSVRDYCEELVDD